MYSYGRKKNEIILFENQGVKLKVNLKDETVWLTQKQMAELFDKDRRTYFIILLLLLFAQNFYNSNPIKLVKFDFFQKK